MMEEMGREDAGRNELKDRNRSKNGICMLSGVGK
jgi:hypothetical protein